MTNETDRDVYTFRIAVPSGVSWTDVEAAIKRLRVTTTDADNLRTYHKVLWLSQLTDDGMRSYVAGLDRQAYWDDVNDVVDDIKRMIIDGEITSREDLHDRLHETVDGHSRVIYTAKAKEGLDHTDNADAYVDNFGSEGATEDGEPAWSRLMYAAMEADVLDSLRDNDNDIANAEGYCETCRKLGTVTAVDNHDGACEAHECVDCGAAGISERPDDRDADADVLCDSCRAERATADDDEDEDDDDDTAESE